MLFFLFKEASPGEYKILISSKLYSFLILIAVIILSLPPEGTKIKSILGSTFEP